ncbi:hemolymph lipopolysaccharide-binding protein-like isoform X2 [Lasioglossum baleicum]|uniref:hemolymph lipopolysaccharide-binding protein-like isoform X2 n=1 Tax=Lasioglossum baleicum TaxID=434251 RepID=UPI003FCCA5D5
MNSSAFLAIASAALFVLVFQGGEADDVLHEISSCSGQLITDESSDTKCLEYNTTRLIRGRISCVPTLTRSDYVVVPDVGAYKIHTRKTTWYNARKICLAEGGQLAVMDSQQKHDLFRKWKRETINMGFWLGFHDLFEEGSWVTVNGESIESIDFTPWADNEHVDGDGQNCAVLWMTGMHDYQCTKTAGFICEINLCETLGHRVRYFKHN